MTADFKQTAIDTLAVRGGESARHGYDAVTMPIVCTATYAFANTAEIVAHFEGRSEREEYGRYGNPTVRTAEKKLAALEAAQDAVLFPSGMSAITTLLLALLKPGDHVVLTADCYRRTRQFVTTTLGKFGVRHTIVPPSDYQALERAMKSSESTRLLIAETPTNPYLRIADVARMAHITRQVPRAKLLIDSTLSTPLNMRPLALGADLVVHSCTKYLGGHNDLLAGAVCGNGPLLDALRDARGVFGGMPDPHGAYLLIRGLKTLAVRMRQHNASGERVARFLAGHPAIEHVYYAGLEQDPDHEVAKRQCMGFGGVVSFLVKGDLRRAARFVDSCRLATIGPSMGGVETLIEQPAFMSFYELTFCALFFHVLTSSVLLDEIGAPRMVLERRPSRCLGTASRATFQGGCGAVGLFVLRIELLNLSTGGHQTLHVLSRDKPAVSWLDAPQLSRTHPAVESPRRDIESFAGGVHTYPRRRFSLCRTLQHVH